MLDKNKKKKQCTRSFCLITIIIFFKLGHHWLCIFINIINIYVHISDIYIYIYIYYNYLYKLISITYVTLCLLLNYYSNVVINLYILLSSYSLSSSSCLFTFTIRLLCFQCIWYTTTIYIYIYMSSCLLWYIRNFVLNMIFTPFPHLFGDWVCQKKKKIDNKNLLITL